MLAPDLDAVTRLIHQVSDDIIVPRFRALGDGDVRAKVSAGDLDDIVTIADQEAETVLTNGLRALLDAPVVGEEAAAADASILTRLQGDGPVWIVDPLDGTKNFAAGNDGFGVMVSLAQRQQVRAAWIHLPVRSETFVAESGGGAWFNGARVRVPDTSVPVRPTGSTFVRFMDAAERALFTARLDGRYEPVAASGAAAVEYTDVLRGRKDFVIYYRLLPWDHGTPALILTEAGGMVVHMDGAPYTIASPNQVTVVARSGPVQAQVRACLGGAA